MDRPGDRILDRRRAHERGRVPGHRADAQDQDRGEWPRDPVGSPSVARAALRRDPEGSPAVRDEGHRREQIRRHPHEFEQDGQHRSITPAREGTQGELTQDEGGSERHREGQRLGADGDGPRRDDDDGQDEVPHRPPRVEPAEKGRRVGQTLAQGQARHNERVLRAEYLHRAGTPAVSLQLVGRGVGRRQAAGQDLVVIHGPPTPAVEADRRVDVLRDGVGRDAADLPQCRDAHDGAGPAPERAGPAVLARLEDPIEEGLFVEALAADPVGGGAIDPTGLVLERVDVVELLGRLDQGETRIVEVAQGADEEVGRGDVVGVEDRDELGIDDAEGVIEVARLGVLVRGAGEIVRPEFGRQSLDFGSGTVIEHPGLVVDPHRDGGGDGGGEDLQSLVVGRDEDGDLPGRRGDVTGGRSPIHIPEGEGEERQPQCRVDLQHEQGDRDPPDVEGDGPTDPPHEVDGRHRDGEERDGTDGPASGARLGRRQAAPRECRSKPADGRDGRVAVRHVTKSRLGSRLRP